MSVELLRNTLLWCAVVNYGILLVWFLFFMLAHDWMYLFHGVVPCHRLGWLEAQDNAVTFFIGNNSLYC